MCNFLRKFCILKQFIFHAGYRCQLPPEGPPDGWWSCSSQHCSRECHNGKKVFGISVWWAFCESSDGKWRFWPQQAAHCVGKKKKAIPFFSLRLASVDRPIQYKTCGCKNQAKTYGKNEESLNLVIPRFGDSSFFHVFV